MADIIKRHNLTYHLYASHKLGSDDLLASAKSSIEICAQEINNWMILNGLKLNKESVRVGGEIIQPSSSVRNLGVILDPSIDMEDHIKKICHFHIWIVNLLKQSFMLL